MSCTADFECLCWRKEKRYKKGLYGKGDAHPSVYSLTCFNNQKDTRLKKELYGKR